MPVNSMHSTIKHFISKCPVRAPSERPSFIRAAHFNPFPYKVAKTVHDDFLDWLSKELLKANKNEDGERVPWCSIHLVQVTPCVVKYTLTPKSYRRARRASRSSPTMSSRCALHREVVMPKLINVHGKAYQAPLDIRSDKYRDLVALINKLTRG